LFVYISSTGCYGDYKDDPYCEDDILKPTTVHHKTKALAEEEVRKLGRKYIIARTGWLYGEEVTHKKNFVFQRFLEASGSKSIISDPFQRGNPTYTMDVARQISKILKDEAYGTFNIVGEGTCTRYEYVKAIIDILGLDCEVLPADAPFTRRAPVSKNEAALNNNLARLGMNIMPHWKRSLEEYIHILKPKLY
jgi:dTDP-4-dehydrorhamnose reductase